VKLAFLTLLALLAVPAASPAQGLPFPIPGASAGSPYGFSIKRVGSFDTAPIVFQGQRLFVVAAPAAGDTTAVPAIVQRVDTITDNLGRIVPSQAAVGWTTTASHFDPKTFKVEIGSENGYPTLYATDAGKREVAPIMTLTEADATLYGLSKESLAIQWQAVLQTALGHAILAAQPEYVREQLVKLPFVLTGGILLTLLLVAFRARLRKRSETLEAVSHRVDPGETSGSTEAKRLRIRRAIISSGLWLLSWGVLGTWALIALWMLTLFPGTRTLANELSNRFVRVIVLWLVIAVLDRLLGILIVRATDAWQVNLFVSPDERARLMLRRPTLARAAENLKFILLWGSAIVWSLSILSVSAISVLTIGAIVAFALSFAAQSLIKDYLNGFLILAEDQFAISDRVTINGATGTVEDLTLRITRIRTDEGRLIIVPNSAIATVENSSRGWSRVDLRVAISGSSDIPRAVAALQAALDAIAADPLWNRAILEPPQVLGIDSVSHAGVMLRAWIKTLPSERAAISREVNRRADEALRKAGIDIGAPQAIVTQR
jgi:small-conductance mechanosensitive channel